MTRSTKIVLGITVVLLILSLGGILWYKYKVKGQSSSREDEFKLPAVKIILTNGCGFEGLAKEFTEFLKDKNVDIIATGNTIRPVYDKTIIVVRKGDKEDLNRLQRMTGINRYTEARNETALADFEIIIGKDYEQFTKQ